MNVTIFNQGGGHYTISVDNRVIGHVWKYEQRYNLRRVYVVRGWKAKPLGGWHDDEPRMFNTRREAVDALVTNAA